MKKSVYTMCGMCSVRCPIRVETEDNKVTWIEGNQHLVGGDLCAKGSAGVALLNDKERPQQPLIVAGDFNTWNSRRVVFIRDFARELSLQEVAFTHDKHIRKMFNKKLDHVFYRDLHVEYSKVIKSDGFSDHNPMVVGFSNCKS